MQLKDRNQVCSNDGQSGYSVNWPAGRTSVVSLEEYRRALVTTWTAGDRL